jgi:flagellar motor switch protein FliN/FliY
MTPLEEVGQFLDVPIEMNVELDRRLMTVREIMEFDVESIIRLARSAGENLDIRLGGLLIGSGEIVVSETTTGVRITDFRTGV